MKPLDHRTIRYLLVSFCLVSNKTWAQQAIAITNPSFENPVVTDGEIRANVPDWVAFNNSTTSVLNPSTSDLTNEAPEGANIGSVTSSINEDGLSQTLSSNLLVDSAYTLTVKVANTKFTVGFPGYRVQLLAGSTVLAEDNNSIAIAEDTAVTSTVNYTYSTGNSALVGQPLQIRLLSKGLVDQQEVAFDDIKLTFTQTLTNPVANTGGPYTVPIAGTLSLNASTSLPSDGQTITSYEWDLNNDNTFGDVTGISPTAISYSDLNTVWALSIGAPNTIQLRVTDSAGKISTSSGTVTLAPPIRCQLGVLDLTANGGINPNTGTAWKAGDKYRIAFHTLGTTTTTSNDPNFYNDFATSQAWGVTALKGAYWKAMVTVNLDPTTTQALSPKSNVKDNTGTSADQGGANQGGAGEPVYLVNGTTCIARNNADIWNAWSNPFETSVGVANATGTGNNTNRIGTVFYSPFLDQNGNQTVNLNANHGKNCSTGCNSAGSHVNALGNTTDNTTTNRGNSNANNVARVWDRGTDATTLGQSVYSISVPLTVLNLSETVKPEIVSIADNRSGTDLPLGTGSIIYTVTFSEPIDAETLTSSDISNAGSATITINSIRGTLIPSAFEVTVTPTTAGTIQLQTIAGATIEDPVGNTMNTVAAVNDDTTINVTTDSTTPTLVSITDNVPSGTIVAFNSVTYTVTFSEAIIASTLNTDDFSNSGTAPININSISPTANPATYTLVATPTASGSLNLEIKTGATITDLVGNALNATTPSQDDTTITVTPDPLPTVTSIIDNQAGGPVLSTQAFTYFVTFSHAINPTSVDVTDFVNSGSPAITVNAVSRTDNPSRFAVHVSPGGIGSITLHIASAAVITNLNGTAVDTVTAIADDTTISVIADENPARKTISVDAATSWSATTSTLTGTINASASDKLVVIVTGENSNPGGLSGNSTAVTYDGVALTKIIDRNPIGGTPFDQTFNDVWYLDNPKAVHVNGAISVSVDSRASVTAFALSGTAAGFGQTAISPQASKTVTLSTTSAKSIVIAAHGMGGDGNTANVAAVTASMPLEGMRASAQASGSPSPWDGHVCAYAFVSSAGTTSYAFAGGNLTGSHTIAAEFLAAVASANSPYSTWASTNSTSGNPSADFDGDGVPNAIEFVIGGDKDSNDLRKLPATSTNGGNMSFTFIRNQTSVHPSVGTVIEVSTNLVTWPTIYNVGADTASSTMGVTVTNNLNGTDTVVLTIPQTPDDKKFARLKVSIAP